MRGRRVDQRDAGSFVWKVHRVDEGVRTTDGVTGKNVRAGDVRSREKPVEVGGEFVSVLPFRRFSAPALTGTVKGADASLASDRRLNPSPVWCSLAEAVEQHHRWRSRADAVQEETVAIDEIGATRRGRVARRRLGDGLEGSANRDESQDEEGWVEKSTTRPVVEGAARSPHRPDNQDGEQRRPHPPEQFENVIARRQCDERDTDDPEAHGRSESPTLRLICPPTGKREEGQHAAGERDQGCARDHGLACAGEHNEDEYEAKSEASDD